MTIEHNLYLSENDKSNFAVECERWRNKLNGLGYKLLVKNVIFDGHGAVEDWWVDQELFDIHGDLQASDINCRNIKI